VNNVTVTLHDGRQFPASIKGYDEATDIALLEIVPNGVQLPVGGSRETSVLALDIVDNCGHLPLATCIAATRLAVRPLQHPRRLVPLDQPRPHRLTHGCASWSQTARAPSADRLHDRLCRRRIPLQKRAGPVEQAMRLAFPHRPGRRAPRWS